MTKEKACKTLGLTATRSDEELRKAGGRFLNQATISCPLKFKAAAAFLVRL